MAETRTREDRTITVGGKRISVTAIRGPDETSQWRATGNLRLGVPIAGTGPSAEAAFNDWERAANARAAESKYRVKSPAFGRAGAVYVVFPAAEAERFKEWAVTSEHRVSVTPWLWLDIPWDSRFARCKRKQNRVKSPPRAGSTDGTFI